jgi:RHS repeat-associated protein
MIGYGEFGALTANTAPGFQPFTFAGGLYDADTGLVRFGARDYDPHTGRWTTKEPLGFAGGDTNFYAYAFSDPVNLVDPNGLYAVWDDLAFAVAGALVGAGGQALADAINGEFSGWGAYGRAALGGAVGGWATLYGGPVLGGAAGSFVTNLANQTAARSLGTQCGWNLGSLAVDTTLGAVAGRFFGAASMSGGVRRGSAAHVYKTMRTKLKNGTVTTIRPQTGVKMFAGAFEEHQMAAGTAAGVATSIGYSNLTGGDGGCGCP